MATVQEYANSMLKNGIAFSVCNGKEKYDVIPDMDNADVLGEYGKYEIDFIDTNNGGHDVYIKQKVDTKDDSYNNIINNNGVEVYVGVSPLLRMMLWLTVGIILSTMLFRNACGAGDTSNTEVQDNAREGYYSEAGTETWYSEFTVSVVADSLELSDKDKEAFRQRAVAVSSVESLDVFPVGQEYSIEMNVIAAELESVVGFDRVEDFPVRLTWRVFCEGADGYYWVNTDTFIDIETYDGIQAVEYDTGSIVTVYSVKRPYTRMWYDRELFGDRLVEMTAISAEFIDSDER